MSLKRISLVILCATIASCAHEARAAGRKRALIVAINDYTASKFARSATAPVEKRDWPNLVGAINDGAALQEMLVRLYGFDRRDIVSLLDHNATRAAILQALDQLARTAAKDDVLFVYYAGHGSQVRNTLSEEPDKLDESIVPADSRAGALDIRDKELRVRFNRMLDRGARLTVLLDNCHSGSGARGLPTGARPRGITLDPRDVKDGSKTGPRPEDQGALVLSAAQDYDRAWETRGSDGKMHGAFSWAWIRALRDASPGEPAVETFLRAQARLRLETPFQQPVLAGNTKARLRPFLGTRIDRAGERAVVAVRRVRPDGTIDLQGGWANGLSSGSELRLTSDPRIRVTITSMEGLGSSKGRLKGGGSMPAAIRSGALLEVVGWAAPPGRPLRVWMPRGSANDAAALVAEAKKRGLTWVADPTERTPAYLLRPGRQGWELVGGSGIVATDGAISKVPRRASLFVQFPAPFVIAEKGVEAVERADDADYVLAGRFIDGRLSYAWVRPLVRASDSRLSGLPSRTVWSADQAVLRDQLLRLRRIHGWLHLESPPRTRSPYRLAIRRERDGAVVQPPLAGGETYSVMLRAAVVPRLVQERFFYAFTIDSDGRSVLLYPRNGSVENRFPLTKPPPSSIALGSAASFEVTEPYGADTYVLLSTDEPLPNPAILEWDGVRGPPPAPSNALEELLLSVATGSRSVRVVTPATWSIERVVCESVAPPSHDSRRAVY